MCLFWKDSEHLVVAMMDSRGRGQHQAFCDIGAQEFGFGGIVSQ